MAQQQKYIRLMETLQTGNRITFRFASNLDCFRSDSFYVDYGERACSAPESIKNVAFAAVMAPIAWATGAELTMGCLDKTYLESLSKCKEYFIKWKPKKWSFAEKIIAQPVTNTYAPNGYGLLFSGGLDALTSFIKHQDKKPELFTVIGGDIPLDKTEYIQLCKERFLKFSTEQGVTLSFIYTDAMECLDAKKLRRFSSHWYAEICHSLLLTGLVAPVGAATLKTLFIASSHVINKFLWGSSWALDNHIRWAGTEVLNDNADLNRLQKMSKYFVGQDRLYKYLRVCWNRLEKYNCSQCEKCLRTMMGLLVHNIDPAECNFIIDDRTLPELKKKIASYIGFHRLYRNAMCGLEIWDQMKMAGGSQHLKDMYGSHVFLEWMKGQEFEKRPMNPAISALMNLRMHVKQDFSGLLRNALRKKTRTTKYIRLLGTLQTGNRITFRFASNLDCFRSDSFYVDYGERACSAPESIKNVAFAAVMAPIAWATGAELTMGSLDKTYLESLPRCKEYFIKWKPKNWSFAETIIAQPVVNTYAPNGHGLLFSGGLDALTSYIKHQDKKLELFTVIGGDIPIQEAGYVKFFREQVVRFSIEQNVPLTIIQTDIMECLDSKKLRRFSTHWYAEVCHSLLLTGLVAPIGAANLKTLLIASSHTQAQFIWGSDAALDDQVAWAGTRVVNDNGELERVQKVGNYFKGNDRFYKYLHVCWAQLGQRNCSRCEKCLSTIVALLIHNVDPVRCNFPVDERTLPELKKRILSCLGFHRLFRRDGYHDWEQMTKAIDLEHLEDRYGAREFLEWMKGYDFSKCKCNPAILALLDFRWEAKVALGRFFNCKHRQIPL